MTDYESLPHDLRVSALVGEFMRCWALMEAQLNEAIVSGLELNELTGVIVVKNTQLRKKIDILKSACHLAFPDETREHYIDLLNKITSMSESDRNVAAHDAFGTDENGDGVQFLVAKARGKLKFPDVRWSIADCEKKFADLGLYGAQLKGLGQSFKNHHLLRKLRQGGVPNAMLEWPEIQGLLDPHPGQPRNSDTRPATPEKDA